MYKQCKTEQSAGRQRELEQGLLQAMSVQQYEEISVSDLCVKIGIPRKSFYRYFSGKEGALHALVDHSLMEYEGYVTAARSPQERPLVNDLESFFRFWVQKKPLLDALQRSGLSGVLIERAISHAIGEVEMSGKYLSIAHRSMREQIIMFSTCGLMSMVLNWHKEGYPETPAQMGRTAARLLTEPLASDLDYLV